MAEDYKYSKMEEMIPRSYQSEIENTCIDKNTIIYLPTGAGKTFISIRIIKRLQNSTQKVFSQGGSRTFFLVNTIPLVHQHCKTIKQLTPLTVRGISSQDKVDIWKKPQWLEALEDTQIFVMTSQILLDIILHGYIQISQINLIIFDECHSAVENHPMRQIMDRVDKANLGDTPRIIGLTATLLNKTIKPSDVASAIEALEKTFKATVCTAENWDEAVSFSANPAEIVLGYKEFNPSDCALNDIITSEMKKISHIFENVFLTEDMQTPSKSKMEAEGFQCISSGKKTMAKIQRLLLAISRVYKEFGLFGLSVSLLTTIVKVERLKLKATLEVKTVLQYFISMMVKIRGICESFMSDENDYDKIKKYASDKVLALLNVLKEYSEKSIKNTDIETNINKQKEELCCIIFVKERSTSLILNIILKMVRKMNKEDFEFLKHDYITGFNVNPFSDTREDLFEKKKNMETVSKFRERLLNCLISTAVLEEGFDLPTCNLIIHFDDLVTFRSYIQSKGRGRLNTASFVMMIPTKNKENFSKTYKTFKTVIETLNKILVGKSDERNSPTDEEVSEAFQTNISPFIHKNACITTKSAISLLNRYCTTLPHDIYTRPQPVWYHKKVPKGQIVSVILPVNSVLKDNFCSPPMTNRKEAKQYTALKVLEELHKIGELNDNLLPVTREEIILNEDNHKLFFNHWNEFEIDDPDVSKNMRVYKKTYPHCLRGIENESKTFYLYKINITPINIPNSNILKIINKPYNYGILTYQKMEKICPFSLFLSSGEVLITIQLSDSVINLSDEELLRVKQFHLLVFSDIIGLNQTFTVFDPACDNNHMYILPLIGENFELDWDVMITKTRIETFQEPSVDERKDLVVTNEKFLHHIVNPWYRGDSSCLYIVTEIHDDMSPCSLFPTSNFESFADYYYEKYKLRILGSTDQPLLGVDHIGGKMNCLLPRSISLSADENTSRRKLKSTQFAASMVTANYDEVLIPEYCIKYSFPGIYWFKATLIPSVVHRISMLMQAEELRQKICKEIDIKYLNIPEEFSWDPLMVDIHALRNSHKKLLSTDIPKHQSAISDEDISLLPQLSNQLKLSNSAVSYEITKRNLDLDYPWNAEEEPVDIFKNIDEIKIIDIECYEKFVNEKLIIKPKSDKDQPSLPKKFCARAICPPPNKYNDVINILEKKPTPYGPTIHQILATLTTSKCNDVFNLERYETLGDSFLKFAVSLFLWHMYPRYNEGQLTALKGKIVSNRNLFYSGLLFNLGGIMNVKQFSAKSDWIPPGFTVPKYIFDLINGETVNPSTLNFFDLPKAEIFTGKLSNKTIKDIDEKFAMYALNDTKYDYSITEAYLGKQTVRNKSIADSVEALIGVYLLDSGIEGGFKMLKWLRVLPLKDGDEYVDYLKIKIDTPLQLGLTNLSNISFQLNYFTAEIEKILGYKFNDPSYLLEAMSHSSNIRNNITGCYQRLEFIGDAILDFLITTYIYENCGTLSPGDITDLRSALVNNVTFGCIVVRLGLQKFVLTANNELDKAMQKFIQYQDDRDHIIDETVLFLLDEGGCHLANYVDVPKVLGDIFESVAGAIFFDSGNDLTVVWKVFYRFMHAEIDAFSRDIPKQPVRLLYERIHAQPKFQSNVITNDGERVMVPLKINVNGKTEIVHGFGDNRKNAKRSAAKIALKILDN